MAISGVILGDATKVPPARANVAGSTSVIRVLRLHDGVPPKCFAPPLRQKSGNGRMLETLGYAAVPAASGGEALRLIASGLEIDLVLADFAMPEMTGVELAETIHTTHPAFILVTGYSNREALKDFG
jgi:hypothetical protein